MRSEHRVVVDLGGTNLTVGYSPDCESFEWIRSDPINKWNGSEEWLNSLLSDRPETRKSEWIVGVPGPCGEEEPERTPNLPSEWNLEPLNTILSQNDISSYFENDAHLAALGIERNIPQTPDCLLGITLGTGIGGGIVQNGALYRGSTGVAAEVGHIVLHPGGRSCSCGKNGCLETYASARGLEATFKERTGTTRSAHKIAKDDGEEAQKSFDKTGRDLGRGLAIVANVLNPDGIYLSGGLTESFDRFRDSMRESFRRNVFAKSGRRTPIKPDDQDYPALHGGLGLFRT